MKIAYTIGAHYMDMASSIDQFSFAQATFPQYQYHDQFVKNKKIALINTGISPGITECILAQMLL
jgi:saccharopine dehydrogenase-like NADP-dependent oxidoreductase